jgi:arylsulfatase A-like enzyme
MDNDRVRPPGARAIALLVPACGLFAGYLELTAVLAWRTFGGVEARLGKDLLHRHFLWMTPAATLLVFCACGVVPLLLSRFWPRTAWRIATALVAFLVPFVLIVPVRGLYLLAAALFAGGMAYWLVRVIAERGAAIAPRALPVLLAVWLVLLSVCFGRDALRESSGRRSPPPQGAPNVLLVVLDTVRADALTPYGAPRDTTPSLARLAAMGTRFQNARSTAPWTLPSHASMFTGRLPAELGVSPTHPLDDSYQTIAEHLQSRGYATGGFVANFIFGAGDYGLGRGFAHYEDRPFSLEDLFGCSAFGRRIAAPALDATRLAWSQIVGGPAWYNPADPYFVTHRRSAAEIRKSFIHWADRTRRQRRPFFAFLNLLDAHAPYLPADRRARHFGKTVECWADYRVLRDWDESRTRDNLQEKRTGLVSDEERALARDCYDDCLAVLDKELGRLVNDLAARSLLENTVIVVTSDHGENFGEHDLYSHGISLHRPELDVPLLMIWPGHIPAGRVVNDPVSLRDLPATLADLSGQASGAAFPGRSLARRWQGDSAPEPLFSELPELGTRAVQEGTKVLIRYRNGVEQFYDHALDPAELWNIVEDPGARYDVARLRATIDGLGTVRR